MKKILPILFSFCCLYLCADNLELTSELFLSPAGTNKKNVNEILKDKETQKLFSATIRCLPGTASICTLRNYFEFQSSGFRIQSTPSSSKKGKKTTRIVSEIDWNLQSEGPYLASGTESFYEGTIIHSTRSLLPGVFSPLGINHSRDAKQMYIPAVQYSHAPKQPSSVFTRNSKWEITVKILENGIQKQILRTTPVYHQGRFPVKNPVGIQSRMYNHRGITVLNMYCNHKRGTRKNGSPVFEQLELTLCFLAPPAGKETMLAELNSYCFAEGAAFFKLPSNGGKRICYQVFLTVK